ncbi:MAG: 30S ribosomal protein S6e [Candidatus Bathyarchaeota archaeon]|nr:30S ribosomal protein S6e [Candidatus Bathyarchaeota archaeon]
MAKFKIILSDPETGKSQIVETEGPRAVPLLGRRLGEEINGTTVGMGGHKLKITGGSDKDGFPMRPDIHGGVKTRAILTKGVGFHSTRKGERRRKTLRGNVITEEIVQINMKILQKPSTSKKSKLEKTEAKPKEEESPKQKPEATEQTEGKTAEKASEETEKETESQETASKN